MQAGVGCNAGFGVIDAMVEAVPGLGPLLAEQALAFYVRAQAYGTQGFDQTHGHMAFADGGNPVGDGQEARRNSAVAFRQVGVVAVLAQAVGALYAIGIGRHAE
ncbi:hypothetical protein D3C86_1373710 [compost metagenome]